VLRPSRDEVGIFIGPSKVLLVKMRGRLKPRCVAEQVIRIDAGNPGDSALALDALTHELSHDVWHNSRVRIVVSDLWVHYDVLPWSIELSREAERLAHARFLLAATYGEVAEQWAVALSAAAPGASRLISAMPQALLADLKGIGALHGLKVVSVQPQLVVAYKLWRHRLPRSAAWIATIDESSLVAMHLRDGRCDRVRAVRISDDWASELQRIQTMGRLAQSRPAEGPIFVDAPLCIRAHAGQEHAAVNWLEGSSQPNGTLAQLAAMREAYV
jgi:hypothetical protein